MKRLFFLLLLALFVTTTSPYAQVQFGVKAGLHISHVDELLSNKDLEGFLIEENAVKAAPQLGLMMSVPLTQRINLQPELLWTRKNWQHKEFKDGLRFDYLSLPVLFGYQAGNWRLNLGPELTFLMDQRFTNGNGKSPFVQEKNLGVAANLGVQYHLNHWIVGLRANRDLNDFQSITLTDVNGTSIVDLKYYHQGLTLWVGYQLAQQ
ncbi:porin family protein [Lewinella sp. LCG006]|uniref:porin family protein n=1 Tax=Lewinella sp. LCG006 TaxID=3231911 RepID=UPI0034603396